MGELILTMHTSADGFVATESGEMWPAFGWPPEAQIVVNELYREASAVVYGRTLYETVVPFWTRVASDGVPEGAPLGPVDVEFAHLMVDLPKYVVSHDVTPSDPRTTAIHRNVIERLTAVKEAAVGHVLLLAGGGLAAELARAGILDQLFLLTGPIVLGRGRPLLDLDEPLPTRLLSAQALPPSCTILRYAVELELPTSR